jgi:hypothetical protein
LKSDHSKNNWSNREKGHSSLVEKTIKKPKKVALATKNLKKRLKRLFQKPLKPEKAAF